MTHLTGIQSLNSEMQQCVQNCLDCHSICLATVPHCLQMGGEHASQHHITTLLSCAEICSTSANFMLLGSHLHPKVCGVCAEACQGCADECERMANGDAQMMACAEACRRCFASCRNMTNMVM